MYAWKKTVTTMVDDDDERADRGYETHASSDIYVTAVYHIQFTGPFRGDAITLKSIIRKC